MKVPLLDLKAQYVTIEDEITRAINEVCKSSQFVLGPFVKKFEEEIAKYCEAKWAIGVASGTDALTLSLEAIGIKPGDEVITTPYTFFATAGTISRLKAIPVFVDIEPKTYNINPELIEEKITKKTKAIIPVHLYGQCADMDKIMGIANKYNLRVIEDAAQALGAKYKGKCAGTIGDLGCFSFFPSKNLGGFGDGGMVITDNEELAQEISILRVHGSKPKYYHSIVGYNSRLDALQAAVLSVKLKYLETWIKKRQVHAALYNQVFKDTGIITPFVEEHNFHVYNQYIIRVKNRDEMKEYLEQKGIGTEIYYPLPLHLQECYKYLGYHESDFPESEGAAKETLSIPVYPELTEDQQREVAQHIKDFLPRGRG